MKSPLGLYISGWEIDVELIPGIVHFSASWSGHKRSAKCRAPTDLAAMQSSPLWPRISDPHIPSLHLSLSDVSETFPDIYSSCCPLQHLILEHEYYHDSINSSGASHLSLNQHSVQCRDSHLETDSVDEGAVNSQTKSSRQQLGSKLREASEPPTYRCSALRTLKIHYVGWAIRNSPGVCKLYKWCVFQRSVLNILCLNILS